MFTTGDRAFGIATDISQEKLNEAVLAMNKNLQV